MPDCPCRALLLAPNFPLELPDHVHVDTMALTCARSIYNHAFHGDRPEQEAFFRAWEGDWRHCPFLGWTPTGAANPAGGTPVQYIPGGAWHLPPPDDLRILPLKVSLRAEIPGVGWACLEKGKPILWPVPLDPDLDQYVAMVIEERVETEPSEALARKLRQSELWPEVLEMAGSQITLLTAHFALPPVAILLAELSLRRPLGAGPVSRLPSPVSRPPHGSSQISPSTA